MKSLLVADVILIEYQKKQRLVTHLLDFILEKNNFFLHTFFILKYFPTIAPWHQIENLYFHSFLIVVLLITPSPVVSSSPVSFSYVRIRFIN